MKTHEEYTQYELMAQKWLDETDTMQFSEMELLTMFAAHQQVKNNALLHDVSEWVAVSERTPICYMTGDWDGKMSDLLLVQDEKGRYHLANCYEYHDGQTEWYDQDDYGLRHEIMKWKAVE